LRYGDHGREVEVLDGRGDRAGSGRRDFFNPRARVALLDDLLQ
jgi:hypothetical protein